MLFITISFARRLDTTLVPPEDVLSLMRSYDVIAFDGDALYPESFTKFVVSLLASCVHGCDQDSNPLEGTPPSPPPPPPPKILAYRLDYSALLSELGLDSQELEEGSIVGNSAVVDVSRESLLASWHQSVAILSETGNITVRGHNQEQEQEQELSHTPVHEVTIFVKTLRPSLLPEQRSPYLELGLQALLNSGSSCVLTAGGGVVVGQEFALYQTQIPSLRWHAWLLDRAIAATGGEEAPADSDPAMRREKSFFQQLIDEGDAVMLEVQVMSMPVP